MDTLIFHVFSLGILNVTVKPQSKENTYNIHNTVKTDMNVAMGWEDEKFSCNDKCRCNSVFGIVQLRKLFMT